MNSESVNAPTRVTLVRVSAFTLGTALAWVGHECGGKCPVSVAELPAKVRFLCRPTSKGQARGDTLVVVEFASESPRPPQFIALLRAVNDCTRPDRIRVRERTSTDQGHAQARLTYGDPENGPVIYLQCEDPGVDAAPGSISELSPIQSPTGRPGLS